ncbi:MAG TPA: hypothetical protein VFA20_25760 [Myxococcaceae bacterium]|nr:hypothetical protein [Myxococcaceae bacterium]
MPASSRPLLTITAVLTGFLLLTSPGEARGDPPATASEASQDPKKGADLYQHLRGRILTGTRASLGVSGSSTIPVWGVLMDMGLPQGSATVMALLDGNASIYLSTGGGFLGGVGQPPIRQAAVRMVTIAGELSREAKATSEYPIPAFGQITFYLLTDRGVLTASASEEDLQKARHPFWKLYLAGQDVITQYRLFDEAREAKRAAHPR